MLTRNDPYRAQRYLGVILWIGLILILIRFGMR